MESAASALWVKWNTVAAVAARLEPARFGHLLSPKGSSIVASFDLCATTSRAEMQAAALTLVSASTTSQNSVATVTARWEPTRFDHLQFELAATATDGHIMNADSEYWTRVDILRKKYAKYLAIAQKVFVGKLGTLLHSCSLDSKRKIETLLENTARVIRFLGADTVTELSKVEKVEYHIRGIIMPVLAEMIRVDRRNLAKRKPLRQRSANGTPCLRGKFCRQLPQPRNTLPRKHDDGAANDAKHSTYLSGINICSRVQYNYRF